MKRHFLLLSIILAFNILNAQEALRFRNDHPQGFSIKSSTATSLSLHYAIAELDIARIDNGEAQGQEIILKGCFGSFAEGMPNLPFENRYIAVPKGATISIEVKEKGCQTLSGIEILPAAAVQGNAAVGMPKLKKDMSVFGKDANYPTENVSIAQTTQIRGLDVVLLNVTPFRYNPVRKTLDIIYDMDIEVRFEGGNGQFGEARYRNPAWDNILHDLIINNNMLPEAHYYDLLNEAIKNREKGCEYLIISPDDEDILAYADTLKQFRTKQGILTKVVSVTECGGNDANAIKGYIKNAYDNWAIPPAAVMIFSAVDTINVGFSFYETSSGIPGFGLLFKNYDTGIEKIDFSYSSDIPYSDMNNDSIPDLVLSRLPALTLEEYRTQVNKLINYETNPPTQPDYYGQPIITSGYEDNKWFLITSQSFNGFCRNKLGKHPMNFYMLYQHMSDPIPAPEDAWSTEQNSLNAVNYFGPQGQNYIAQKPDTLNNWRNRFDNSYLVNALNQNSFLILYRDHSAFDYWCCPEIYSYTVKYLTNTDPTFLISIGCDAALYSKDIFYESSSYSQFHHGQKPLVYEFCKAEVGALGGIGATTVTHSHFNDLLTWGMIDNIWPNFMPTLGSTTAPEYVRPSYTLVAGKLFLNQQAFLPNWQQTKINATNNVFHYLGETYLNLYTEVPQQMAIDAEPFCNDPSLYTMTAEEGATICLTHGDDILAVAQATGHPQDLALPNLPIGEWLTVTVTKQNRFRFEKAVRVVSNTLPFVYVKDFQINEQDNNGQLDNGETIDFDVTLYNISQIASNNGEITLVCESPYVSVMQGTAYYPQIGANGTYKIRHAFKLKVDDNVPDQKAIPFKVRFNENENTHEDIFVIKANTPIITINPEFRLTEADGEPSTHISTEGKSKVVFTVTNIGHSSTALLSANLEIKAPFIEIENSQLQIESLAPNETYHFTYELNTLPNTLTGAWLQSRLDVQNGAYHISLDTIIQYGGIFENFESDTLNPLFQWANNGGHKWVFCDDDAYEGNRCFSSNADTISQSRFMGKLKAPTAIHKCKISFHYKTDDDEILKFSMANNGTEFSSKNWQYAEFETENAQSNFVFLYKPINISSAQAKIDDLCFPPAHTTIAYAGDDLIACNESPVELKRAYAYDCDSVVWTTEGDGHFNQADIVNPIYTPGNQDLANGSVALTLSAFGKDTIVSTTTLRFKDEIILDAIVGDSIVNIYQNSLSHYSIENQEGFPLQWQLEPAEAGVIYHFGNAIDIYWGLLDSEIEATLTVTAENGCEDTPVSKRISLIGYSISEWNAPSFDLFPNPTDGKVNLVVSNMLQEKAVVEVYNLLGERMMAKSLGRLQQGETITFDMSRFASGLYIIKLSAENGSCTKKVSVN